MPSIGHSGAVPVYHPSGLPITHIDPAQMLAAQNPLVQVPGAPYLNYPSFFQHDPYSQLYGERYHADQFEVPNTMITSHRKNVMDRQTYAGLKTMPPGSYEKLRMLNKELGRFTAHFICKYRGCNRIFTKSTSLIVHYWRHINIRPFTCKICNTSFTQSGTLSRHNRTVHGIKSTAPLTEEQIELAGEKKDDIEEVKTSQQNAGQVTDT